MNPYLVCQFGKLTISNLIKECFGSDFSDIFSKPQLAYIYQYLRDLGACSVLLEREYLDKDYLEDFSRYYVKSFNNGGHKCARLHFFQAENVSHQMVDDVLSHGERSTNYKTIINSYLGFMVIRPLPRTFIGKTCIRHYPKINDPATKKVCLTRRYNVDLFGIQLSIDSVAFQEQDRVVSACATTAIWAALQATNWNNEKQIPSCSEITIRAINHAQDSNNSFPNKGLSTKQILRTLDIEGLRYHHENVAERTLEELRETVRIHIDSNIPLILCADVYDLASEDEPKNLGLHAVTIVGYSENSGGIYLHDDRLGPFTYAALETIKGKSGWALKRRDADGAWPAPAELLVPINLIVPTHKKVRISYGLPLHACRFIKAEWDNLISKIAADNGPEANAAREKLTLSFTLKLTQISTIRKRILNHEYEDPSNENLENKRSFLTGNYARWHWEGAFYLNGKPQFQVFFDATDIPQGNVVSGIFVENPIEAQRILKIFSQAAKLSESEIRNHGDETDFFLAFLRYFRRKINVGYPAYLDEKFGELRAPKYLKVEELDNGDIGENGSTVIFYESPKVRLSTFISGSETLIWAIGENGELLLGKEKEGAGHPSLTGFKPARIAGEIVSKNDDLFVVSSKSGRFSSDYKNPYGFLENAVEKIRAFFPKDANKICIEAKRVQK
jgi:hypothetical protein